VALRFRIELEFGSVAPEERGKPEHQEKNLSEQRENQQQIQPTYDAWTGRLSRATLVGGKCSYHCATPAPRKYIKQLRECFIRYPNTSKWAKNSASPRFFSTLFSVFG